MPQTVLKAVLKFYYGGVATVAPFTIPKNQIPVEVIEELRQPKKVGVSALVNGVIRSRKNLNSSSKELSNTEPLTCKIFL